MKSVCLYICASLILQTIASLCPVDMSSSSSESCEEDDDYYYDDKAEGTCRRDNDCRNGQICCTFHCVKICVDPVGATRNADITSAKSPVTTVKSFMETKQATITTVNPSTATVEPPITNIQPPITNVQLPITNVQPPITNVQLPITNIQPAITNVQPPITPEELLNKTIGRSKKCNGQFDCEQYECCTNEIPGAEIGICQGRKRIAYRCHNPGTIGCYNEECPGPTGIIHPDLCPCDCGNFCALDSDSEPDDHDGYFGICAFG